MYSVINVRESYGEARREPSRVNFDEVHTPDCLKVIFIIHIVGSLLFLMRTERVLVSCCFAVVLRSPDALVNGLISHDFFLFFFRSGPCVGCPESSAQPTGQHGRRRRHQRAGLTPAADAGRLHLCGGTRWQNHVHIRDGLRPLGTQSSANKIAIMEVQRSEFLTYFFAFRLNSPATRYTNTLAQWTTTK